MTPENSGNDLHIKQIEPKATIWLLIDLLIVPVVTIWFAVKDFSIIYDHFIFFGLLFIIGPFFCLIKQPLSDDKNVINLYFDLFSRNYSQFSLIHQLCLITLVIVDGLGLTMILVFIFLKFNSWIYYCLMISLYK